MIDYDTEEVQFQNREAEVSPELAYHMSRTQVGDEFVIEPKRVPYNPDSWKKEKRMIWGGNFAVANGFGMVAENTVKELLKLGVTCYSYGGLSRGGILGSQYVDKSVLNVINKLFPVDCIEIQHCQPPAFKDEVVERQWMYTMFETTHTPRSWIKMINQAERVIVPSSWLVDSWREQGVTIPIHVIGHGFDPKFIHYVKRPRTGEEPYTFLHYGQLSVRKGTDILAKAFLDEFKGQKDVKLIMKNALPYIPVSLSSLPEFPEIEFIHATYSKEEMLDLLQESDCFVFPTRGEGFGLPPFEAMASGLPTIVTPWSGATDYINPQDTLALEYTMERSENFDMIYENFFEADENSGEWALPSMEDLRAKMRWCYEHRFQAAEMGKNAAARLLKTWTWQHKIKELYDLVDSVA